MSFKVSSSIFTIPYVCLYNAAGGIPFFNSIWFWAVSSPPPPAPPLPPQTGLRCPPAFLGLWTPQVFILRFAVIKPF